MHKPHKTVGILGGMGPEATIDLLQRIIRLTPAENDEDHIHCLVDLNPKVPSRMKALIDGDGTDPTDTLINMAQGLEDSGADVLAIACNTAHHYLPAISAAIEIPMISMIDCVVNQLDTYHSGQRIALIGAPMIKLIGLFEHKFNDSGYITQYPTKAQQDQVFDAIKAVKAGQSIAEHREIVISVINTLIKNGANAVIIACTELSVLLSDYMAEKKNLEPPFFIDSAEQLAKEIVNR